MKHFVSSSFASLLLLFYWTLTKDDGTDVLKQIPLPIFFGHTNFLRSVLDKSSNLFWVGQG